MPIAIISVNEALVVPKVIFVCTTSSQLLQALATRQ